MSRRPREFGAIAIICAAVITGGCGAPAPVAREHGSNHVCGARDPQFIRSMVGLMPTPSHDGNTVKTLINGKQIFPAMLEAIRSAKKSITFETYIYWSGEVGGQFAEAFAERARAGVKTHVIVDAIGSDRIDRGHLKLMEEAGVEVVRYHTVMRLKIWVSAGEVNFRTHRKLLVVDGEVGFLGGVGIADVWLGDAENPEQWHDTHYKVEGPIVAHLQGAFAANWQAVTGRVLFGPDFFPVLESKGPMFCQMFTSSPQDGSATMELMFLLSVNAATESIYIGTPYFVPNDTLIDALLAARQRGVRVVIIVPGPHMDMPIVREASRGCWEPLLKAGVEIHEYQPTMYHCKILVVDGIWTSIGSANVDPRSFRLNDEANLNVYDTAFAREQIELMNRDLAQARQVSLNGHNNRPLGLRLTEFLSLLVKPLL